MITSEKEQ